MIPPHQNWKEGYCWYTGPLTKTFYILSHEHFRKIAAFKVKQPDPEWIKEQENPTYCKADRDGECIHPKCPQLRDGEPEKSGRHCPLDILDYGD